MNDRTSPSPLGEGWSEVKYKEGIAYKTNNNMIPSNNNSPTINFLLTIEEANKIFKALGNLPFTEVYELIGKLNDQANKQLSGGTYQDENNVRKIH
jgi:hypothetical protein